MKFHTSDNSRCDNDADNACNHGGCGCTSHSLSAAATLHSTKTTSQCHDSTEYCAVKEADPKICQSNGQFRLVLKLQ